MPNNERGLFTCEFEISTSQEQLWIREEGGRGLKLQVSQYSPVSRLTKTEQTQLRLSPTDILGPLVVHTHPLEEHIAAHSTISAAINRQRIKGKLNFHSQKGNAFDKRCTGPFLHLVMFTKIKYQVQFLNQ